MSFSFADAIFWVAVVCCAAAQWLIVRGTFTASTSLAANDRVPATRRSTETFWAVLPAVALILVFAATWRAIHPAPALIVLPVPVDTTAVVAAVGPSA